MTLAWIVITAAAIIGVLRVLMDSDGGPSYRTRRFGDVRSWKTREVGRNSEGRAGWSSRSSDGPQAKWS